MNQAPPSLLDARRFPRVAAYIQRLPRGLASHPEAQIKASMYRGALDDKSLAGVVELLPAELVDLIERPRLASTWVPSTHVQALYLAIADQYAMTDERFGDWSYRLQKELLGSRLYRALAALASPSALLLGADMRWGSIHRGTRVTVTTTREKHAEVTLSFPDSLYAVTNLYGFGRGLQAVMELSNGRLPSVELGSHDRTFAKFRCAWR